MTNATARVVLTAGANSLETGEGGWENPAEFWLRLGVAPVGQVVVRVRSLDGLMQPEMRESPGARRADVPQGVNEAPAGVHDVGRPEVPSPDGAERLAPRRRLLQTEALELFFNPSNWFWDVRVVVRAVDDRVFEGGHSAAIIVGVDPSPCARDRPLAPRARSPQPLIPRSQFSRPRLTGPGAAGRVPRRPALPRPARRAGLDHHLRQRLRAAHGPRQRAAAERNLPGLGGVRAPVRRGVRSRRRGCAAL